MGCNFVYIDPNLSHQNVLGLRSDLGNVFVNGLFVMQSIPEAGCGLFTDTQIPEGTQIGIYPWYINEKIEPMYTVQQMQDMLGDGMVLMYDKQMALVHECNREVLSQNAMAFINHLPHPNCEFRALKESGEIQVWAIKDIGVAEELRISYDGSDVAYHQFAEKGMSAHEAELRQLLGPHTEQHVLDKLLEYAMYEDVTKTWSWPTWFYFKRPPSLMLRLKKPKPDSGNPDQHREVQMS